MVQRLICRQCRSPAPAGRAADPCPRCGGGLEPHARCSWCARWTTGPACASCSAEVLPAFDFGAARMLVEGGVDRYALPERVRALPRHQHAELSARFDAEWSALQIRIEEARWVDRFLLTRSLAGEVEDLLIASIPLGAERLAALVAGPRPPFDAEDRLREIADESPIDVTRTMASIALIHARRATPRDEQLARSLVAHGEGVTADEAALALGRWWVWSPGRASGRLAERARALLTDGELAPWAAVAASRVAESDEERAELADGLRAAFGARNEDLRFAAALALADEASLAAARGSADPEMRALALRALAGCGSDLAAADLASGPDEVRREILRGLAPPLGPAMLGALLAALIDAAPELGRDLFGFLRSRRFATLTVEERALLAGWAPGSAHRLPLSLLLELLAWTNEPVDEGPRDDAEVSPFVAAATAALSVAGAEERTQVCRDQRFELGRWLFAATAPEAAPVLDVWARDPAAGTPLFQEIIQLHARLNGWGRPADDRTLEHLFGLLDRAGADEALAATVAGALAAERGASGRDKIVAGLWRRFEQVPERRRAIAIAVEPLRHEFKELRRAEDGPLSPARDPAGFFAVMAAADPLDAPALAREAAEAAEAGAGPPADLIDAVVAHIEPLLAPRPCTALWALASVASPAANHFRSHPEDPAGVAAVAALRRGWSRLAPGLSSLSPVDEREARFEHLQEQIETELRLIAEREERRAEDARRRLERQQELARRAAEQEAELRRQREELERHRLELEAAARAAREPGGDSPWDEPLLPDQPLPSIGAYARFLRQLATSGDTLAVLRKHEMTPERWMSCAQAWSRLLSTRPDVALRFSQLYAALA
ncbi:MAG TPA: hypothetical protein VNO33_06775 [Kofleriaceae bacterium]|nr:hypothetical protein [Kofleriaceae bacterium]